MKSICIITSKYPSEFDPAALIFVQQLCWEIADMGIECKVICPIAYNIEIEKAKKLPEFVEDFTDRGSKIMIYYPKYFGFGQQDIKIFNTARLTLKGFHRAVRKTIHTFPEKPNSIYGHFISPAGVTAAKIGTELNIPSFIAYGESSPWSINNLGINFVKNKIKSIDGFIAVSSKNKNELIKLEIAPENKIGVFPNAIRPSHFYPREKSISREKFNLPTDAFIISFTGHFIERKGIDKLVEAINSMDNVYGIFAGKGPLKPVGKNVIYSDLIKHEDLPFFLSASDVFILPTLNEGCSNAIIEAMACGLPIISSDLPFNDDILDNSNSIKINPTSVKEITKAIELLQKNRSLLSNLQQGSKKKSQELTLEKRASNIVQFMNNKISSRLKV